MNGEWCYFKSFFSQNECREILELSASIPFQDSKVGLGSKSTTDSEVRKSKIKFIQSDNKNFKFLFDSLWSTALQANKDFFNFHITKLDYIQLAEYDESYQGEYKEHRDVFFINDDPFFHRKLSCVVQLSDPHSYIGGDLEFTDHGIPSPNQEDIKQQGSIIFFPSLLYHKANKVTKGKRYSIAAWFDGPKWR